MSHRILVTRAGAVNGLHHERIELHEERRAKAECEGVRFGGEAASVQDREGGLVLSLGAAGEVRYREYGLSAEKPAAVRTQKDSLTVSVPTGHAGTTMTLTAPGDWTLKHPPTGATMSRKGADRYVLALPAGTVSVKLTK